MLALQVAKIKGYLPCVPSSLGQNVKYELSISLLASRNKVDKISLLYFLDAI